MFGFGRGVALDKKRSIFHLDLLDFPGFLVEIPRDEESFFLDYRDWRFLFEFNFGNVDLRVSFRALDLSLA